MDHLLIGISIVMILFGVVSMIVMTSFCMDRGIKINWPLIRLFIFKYVHQYYKITREENGKPGFWFYSFIISMNGAAALVIIAVILRG